MLLTAELSISPALSLKTLNLQMDEQVLSLCTPSQSLPRREWPVISQA